MPELEELMIRLSFADLCSVYDYAIAEARGETLPELSGHLIDLIASLRDRVWQARATELLGHLPDAPAWLEAQRQLKARSVS